MKPFEYRIFRFDFLVLGILALVTTGCNKKVEAVFERPPAVASDPGPTETPTEQSETDVEPPEPLPEVEEELPPTESTPPPVKRRPSRIPTSQPAPPPPPDPPLPRLSPGSNGEETRSIRNKLARAEFILSSLGKRTLTAKQREQAAAARAFVSQAKAALEEGDTRRAGVLADKALILARDVEGS